MRLQEWHKEGTNGSIPDRLALCVYQSVNLASLWSRERSTVTNNTRWVKKGVEYNSALGQGRTYPTLGPMPLEDVTGHGAAAQMLLASLEPGKYHASYSQYEMIRKLRSAYSSLWSSSASGAAVNVFYSEGFEGSLDYFIGLPDKFGMVQEIRRGSQEENGSGRSAAVGFLD
jgi:hypothetical protein